MNQKELILKKDWDFLVLLDACRYDIFKDLYPCKKAISCASWTLEWLEKVWTEYHNDIIYISTNPHCASNYISNRHHRYGGCPYFDGKKHFFKIVDVWDFGWNTEACTVFPIDVNKAFHKTYLKYPNKKYILHYMQPHRPYITIGGKAGLEKRSAKERHHSDSVTKGDKQHKPTFHHPKHYLPEKFGWMVANFMNRPLPPYANIWIKEGRNGLIRVYKNEIINVMRYVNMLTDTIEGKWIITSDHGEHIGHFLMNTHGGGKTKEMVEVPWMEV